jgi:nucleotide-binding universal stress UspA family protein
MYDTILVPTDGSQAAETAAATGIALASQFDAELHALHVEDVGELPPGVEDDEAGPLERQGQQAVDDVTAMAADAGVAVATAFLTGDADVHRAILNYVAEHDVDCVVMGTHGRTGLGRFVLGSVAERTIREAPVPVLTVHEETAVPTAFDSVMVATDGSECSALAVEHALEFADATGASVHATYVVDDAVAPDGAGLAVAMDALEDAGRMVLDGVAERAAEVDATVETALLHGTPYRAIVEYADEQDVDCIVVGTHGRTGMGRLLLGSIAERIVRLADVPVLTVGGPAETE